MATKKELETEVEHLRHMLQVRDEQLAKLITLLEKSSTENAPPVYPPYNYQWTKDDQTWFVVLNRYHRDNLISLFNAIGYGRMKDGKPITGIEPFSFFNTGDWVGEIPLRLRRLDGSYTIDEHDHPNQQLDYIEQRVQQWRDSSP